MLKYIKKLFEKQEEIEEKTFTLDELNNWLLEKKASIGTQIKPSIGDSILKIQSRIQNVLGELDKLKSADLQNPNIPNRAKTIMEGNRDSFIKTMNRLFEAIDLSYDSYSELQDACKSIQKEIDDLAKSSGKSYQVLNQFFAREVQNIAIEIKHVAKELKNIHATIKDSNYSRADAFIKTISEVKRKIGIGKELKDKQNKAEEHKKNQQDLLVSIENEIEQLHEGSLFKEYTSYLEELNENTKKIKEVEHQIINEFSGLDKALKKYSKITIENSLLIRLYSDDPTKALSEDNEMNIVNILSSLSQQIENDKLGLDEKKKQKALGKCKQLNEDLLQKLHKKITGLKETEKSLKSKIKENKAKKLKDDFQEKYDQQKVHIETASQELRYVLDDVAKNNIGALKDKLQENVNESLNTRITLV